LDDDPHGVHDVGVHVQVEEELEEAIVEQAEPGWLGDGPGVEEVYIGESVQDARVEVHNQDAAKTWADRLAGQFAKDSSGNMK
jgi:hypothetical protein